MPWQEKGEHCAPTVVRRDDDTQIVRRRVDVAIMFPSDFGRRSITNFLLIASHLQKEGRDRRQLSVTVLSDKSRMHDSRIA